MTDIRGERVVLTPTVAGDGEGLREILASPAVAAWWGPEPEGFPLDDEPDAVRLTILLDGRIAGLIQFTEEPEADCRHASIDLFVAPELHRRGVGGDALGAVVRHLLDERGHHRLTIDPAVANTAAIGCYRKAGFGDVGVMHRAWRHAGTGEWHDLLLMELVRPAA